MAKGKKTGGRTKDTPNIATKTAREVFIATIEGRVSSINAALDYVEKDDPAKYLELIAKFAQYFVPKQVEMKLDNNIIEVIAPGKK